MATKGEGFYSVQYVGIAGFGAGVLVFETGMVVGADAGGGLYDGTYTVDTRRDVIHVKVTLTVAPGVGLVQGVPPQAQAYKVPIETSIPRNTAGPFLVETGPGLVAVVMRKIRDFPN